MAAIRLYIFNSEDGHMSLFRKKLLIFVIPLLVAIMIPFGKYLYAGIISCELLPFDTTAFIQRVVKPNVLLGMGYNEQTPYYKLKNANQNKAPVIALGTSRVMQFSSRYFRNNAFYNCGGAVRYNFDEYTNFLKNLKYTPKVVILGIDFWLFNESFIGSSPCFQTYKEIVQTERSFNDILHKIEDDFKAEKWTISELNSFPSEIGFNGRIKQSGFRKDGSYYYGDVYRNPEKADDYEFKDTLDRIKNGNKRFEYGEELYVKTINDLDDLLKYCSEKEIAVVGFLPPVAPTVYDTMLESGKYDYILKIPGKCEEIFNKYSFIFEDCLDMSEYGITDDYYIDGFHGSEVVYASITKLLLGLDKEEVLKDYIDAGKIDQMLAARYSSMIFDPVSE